MILRVVFALCFASFLASSIASDIGSRELQYPEYPPTVSPPVTPPVSPPVAPPVGSCVPVRCEIFGGSCSVGAYFDTCRDMAETCEDQGCRSSIDYGSTINYQTDGDVECSNKASSTTCEIFSDQLDCQNNKGCRWIGISPTMVPGQLTLVPTVTPPVTPPVTPSVTPPVSPPVSPPVPPDGDSCIPINCTVGGGECFSSTLCKQQVEFCQDSLGCDASYDYYACFYSGCSGVTSCLPSPSSSSCTSISNRQDCRNTRGCQWLLGTLPPTMPESLPPASMPASMPVEPQASPLPNPAAPVQTQAPALAEPTQDPKSYAPHVYAVAGGLCFPSRLSGETVCFQHDFPQKGLYTDFTNCPYFPTSVFDCQTCKVVNRGGSTPQDLEDSDPECTNCTVCTASIAYDCPDFVGDFECLTADCDGCKDDPPGPVENQASPVPNPAAPV